MRECAGCWFRRQHLAVGRVSGARIVEMYWALSQLHEPVGAPLLPRTAQCASSYRVTGQEQG